MCYRVVIHDGDIGLVVAVVDGHVQLKPRLVLGVGVGGQVDAETLGDRLKQNLYETISLSALKTHRSKLLHSLN